MEASQTTAKPAGPASGDRNKKGICDYAIYREGESVLVVPSEPMLLVHEESTERAVARRAGLGRTVASRWRVRNRDKPWLMDYLYHADLSDDVLAKAAAARNRKAWQAFRVESRVESIVRAVRSRVREEVNARLQLVLGDGGLTENFESSRVRTWRARWRKEHAAKYPEFDFTKWLLRGQEPLPNVSVATAAMIRRHTLAFDYVAHCEKAGVRHEVYNRWLRTGRIPGLPWLKWLYGANPPADVFIVTPELRRLRSETTPARLFKLARTNDKRFAAWQRSPIWKAALDDAIRAADAGTLTADAIRLLEGACFGKTVEGVPESLNNLRSRKPMVKYALAQTLKARCQRAGMSITAYEKALREAERWGVRQELEAFIKSEPPYTHARARKLENKLPMCGLVKPTFFIPTSDMQAFRQVAIREWSRQGILWTGNHPAFDNWFVDWTTADARHGSRLAFERLRSGPERHRSESEFSTDRFYANYFNDVPVSELELVPRPRVSPSSAENGEAQQDPGPDAPIDPRWRFGVASFHYGDEEFPLSGQPLDLLKLLVEANSAPVTISQIRDSISADYPLDAGTVRTQISRLNTALKALLELNERPITRAARGAYVLTLPKIASRKTLQGL